MRVRFSHDIFRAEEHGGVSRYFRELHEGLRVRGHDSRIIAPLHISQALSGVDGVRGMNIGVLRPTRVRQGVSKLVDSALGGLSNPLAPPPDVFHHTYYSQRNPRAGVHIVTVYDMIHELYPGDFDSRDRTAALKAQACQRADLVIAISESTRSDLIERLALSEERVVAIPLGVGLLPAPANRLVPFPYLLFVGSRQRRYKNFAAVLRALAQSSVDREIGLLCFGGGPLTPNELDQVQQSGLAGRVHVASGDDRALSAAYRDALGLVYVSMYEGFGLPPLEAMASRCPVVASRRGAIPETVGAAALLVDPSNIDEIAGAMNRLVADETLRASLVNNGLDRVKDFSWDYTTDRTISVYRRALEARQRIR